MKVKLELDLPEADIIFKALKVIDPATIFCGVLKEKIVKATQPVIDKEKK
jgi:hypothetical protein